ncbi:MAG: ABC transporter ATP-binding protein, partial [Candidatus Heimdallarchaeota archaeon]|nr:ABC transporter ATP-binding protein [Candidatus Heimdallarchaeota archaeon]
MSDIEIEEEFAQRKLTKQTLFRLSKYMKPHLKPLIITLVLEVFWVGLLVSGPKIVQYTIDEFLIPKKLSGLWIVTLVYLFVLSLRTFIGINQFRMMCRFGFSFLNDLRIGLFNHIQVLSIRYFDKTKQGRIIARVDNDVDTLEHAFVWGPLILTHCFFMILSTSFVMIMSNVRLWFLLLLLGFILIIFTRVFSRLGRKAHRRIRESYSQFVASFAESVAGAKIIKAFNQEERAHGDFQKKVYKHKFDFIKGAYIWSMYFPSIGLMYGFATAIVIVFGGSQVLQGLMTIGEVSAFVLL